MSEYSWRWSLAALFLSVAAAGCGKAPGGNAGTGAEAAVGSYFGALVQKDWPAAYAALHPESRKRWDAEQFARLAQHYRKGLGFEPEEFQIRSCEEQGSEAMAHVVLQGHSGAKQRTFKDAVAVRRSGTAWGVVLPAHFGEGR